MYVNTDIICMIFRFDYTTLGKIQEWYNLLENSFISVAFTNFQLSSLQNIWLRNQLLIQQLSDWTFADLDFLQFCSTKWTSEQIIDIFQSISWVQKTPYLSWGYSTLVEVFFGCADCTNRSLEALQQAKLVNESPPSFSLGCPYCVPPLNL